MSGHSSEFKSFESLKVWQKARQIRNEIYQLCKSFPKEETYKLTDQMIRSSKSIGNNIAEGTAGFITRKIFSFADNPVVHNMN